MTLLAFKPIERKLGIAAAFHGILFIVILFNQVAVFGHEGVVFGRDRVTALILAVHPDVGRCGILADPDLVRQRKAGPVGQKAAVCNFAEDGPLFRCRAVDAEDGDLGIQRKVVGLLVSGL